MISILRSKHRLAMMQRAEAMEARVDALSIRLTSTTDRLAAVEAQLDAAVARIEAQAARLDDMTRRADHLSHTVSEHASTLARLDGREQAREELDRRLQADMAKLERQATIDVTELRQTSLVLAERLLALDRRDAGLASATKE